MHHYTAAKENTSKRDIKHTQTCDTTRGRPYWAIHAHSLVFKIFEISRLLTAVADVLKYTHEHVVHLSGSMTYLESIIYERRVDCQVEEVEVQSWLHPFQSVVVNYGDRGPQRRRRQNTPQKRVTANFITASVAVFPSLPRLLLLSLLTSLLSRSTKRCLL